jgi:branched-chain amino acid transport system permease protein
MSKRVKIFLVWSGLAILGFIAIQAAILTGFITRYYEMTLMLILINIMLAVGLNLIVGISGQLSLGHAGFMALGAYTTGIITRMFPDISGFAMGIALGIILSGIVAYLVGLPTLRLKGDYLAIATLGVGEIIRIAILNLDITNGARGLSGIPRLATWYYAYIMVVVIILIAANFTNSSPGRATISIREDEIAAESLGINTKKYKLIAFMIGAMTASVAGAFHATYYQLIVPSQFDFVRSIDILIMVVLGGMGSLTGSVVAAIFLGLLNHFLQDYGSLRVILYAVALILVMIFKPSGLFGRREVKASRLFSRKKKGASNA